MTGEVVSDDFTVPVPVPSFSTVRSNFFSVKFAVTVVAAFTVTVQAPVALVHAPDQPVKSEPVAATAVKVTLLP